MSSLVEIQYNPYLPQVNMLIDGKPPTSFSRLIQYTDEDIWEWANDIFDIIYSEIRDNYSICFVGNDFDAEIVRRASQSDEHCVGFRKKEFIVSDSVQSRLGKLNQLIKKAGLTAYDKTIVDAHFFIPNSLQNLMAEINSIDINNLFCSVRIRMVGAKRNYEEHENSLLFVMAESLEEGRAYMEEFSLMHPAYIIIIGRDSRILDVTKKGIYVETRSEDLFGTIFKCFLHKPLVISLRKCVNSIQGGNKISKELAKIIGTEPIVNVSVGKEVEVGRSIKLSISLEPEIGNVPKLIFKVKNPEIASCDGLNLYGLKEGASVLEVYKQGSSKPFIAKDINVYKRNRITRLIFSDDSLTMGVDDRRQLKLDYYPNDADNRDEIMWRSSDESVVVVNQNGKLVAKKTGRCRIICTAENVSTQCDCIVMPYMEELIIDTDEDGCIHMTPMQERVIRYKCTPADCIDKNLMMSSSDNDVVNIVNGTLYAKNKGTAQISIRNETGRLNRTVDVIVERYMKKEKKRSFFKRLFS